MLALAQRYGAKPVMVREIAAEKNLPPTYLEQLMVLLKKAGLVNATRGAHGGYVLARPPMEITLAEVIEVLEGTLTLSDCPTGVGCCGKPDICALHDIWEEAAHAMRQVFQQITLAQLVERQREKESSPVMMYMI